MPVNLGINKHTYSREQFYNDVAGYIRFKTPSLALDLLGDPDDGMSPLAAIKHLIVEVRKSPSDRELQHRLTHELRMFGCIARAKLRDHARDLRQRARDLARQPEPRPVLLEDLRALWSQLLDGIDHVLTSWRELRSSMIAAPMPRRVREAYLHVDEYLSLVIEDRLTGILRVADTMDMRSSWPVERNRTRDLLMAERSHREGAGYTTLVSDGADNEHYLYRQSLLKKYAMSVLWLEIAKRREGTRAGDLGAAIAAGTAMAFTVMATIMHTQWWMVNTSGFIIAATVTYILKDRIKDWLKLFFKERFGRFLADYATNVTDPATGQRLGRCRETFSYVSPDAVPPDVLELRHKTSTSPIDRMAKQEVVLRYQKEVRLSGSAIVDRLHVEDWDINDIMRFGVSSFFGRADDPQSAVALYDPDSDRVEKRKLPRVYHLNVVLALSAGDKKRSPPTLKRVRVVFDKNGIRRLEEVD